MNQYTKNKPSIFLCSKLFLGSLAVLVLSASLVFGIAKAQYNDNKYGDCAYGRVCLNSSVSPDPSQNQAPGADQDDSGSSSNNVTEPAKTVEDQSIFITNLMQQVESFVSNLPPPTQQALPYYSISWLFILAIILLIVGLLDRRRAGNLLIAIKRLRQAIADQKNFLHLITHHLNTPLAVAKNALEMLNRDKGIEFAAIEPLKMATAELSALSNDILLVMEPTNDADNATLVPPEAIKMRQVLLKWYFIAPVVLSLLLMVAANYIQIRLDLVRPQLYLVYQIIIGIVSIFMFASSLRIWHAAKQQHLTVSKTKEVLTRTSQLRQRAISKLSSGLYGNLQNFAYATGLIHNKKIAQIVIDSQYNLNVVAQRLNIITRTLDTKPHFIKIDELINFVINSKKDVIEKKSIKVNAKNTERIISSYIDELAIALDELIDNALQYSHEGSVLELAVKYLPHSFVVEVRDSGVGMSQQQVDNLFQVFGVAHSALSGNQQHLGMGLFTAKLVLARVEGTIMISSEPNKGTVARVELPIVKA